MQRLSAPRSAPLHTLAASPTLTTRARQVTAYTRADALDTAARQALSARCTAQHPHVTRAVGAEVRDEEALGKAGGAGAGAAGGLRQRWIYHGGGY